MRLIRKKSAFQTSLAAAMVLPAAAMAQTSATAPATDSPELEEVVVTAERREVNLQDVPASATVLTAEAIAAKGVDNVLDIQTVAPSVAINTYNRSTFINIRGVGISQSAPTSNPGVAYYIDGMFIPHEQFIAQTFYDIESIEVLRGPQGTLTGQNSTGGAIYVRTPAPSVDGFSGYVDQTVGEEDWFRTVLALNIPAGDKFALRLSGVSDERSSFTRNIGPSPSDPGSGRDISGRVAFRYLPNDNITLDLRYEHFDRQTDYNAIKRRGDTVSSDPFVIQEDAISFLNQKGDRASLEARFQLSPGIALRAQTSYLDAITTDQADGDRTATALPVPANLPTNGANTNTFRGRVSYTSQELTTWVTEVNLLSTSDSAFQWVFGAFHLNEESPVSVLRDNRNTVNFLQSNSSIITELENTSKSVFGQLDWRFAEAWAVDVGLRYSEDEQTYNRLLIPGAPPPGCFPCESELESDEMTGRVGLKFFLADDVMLYGTASKGYKAGGINLDPRLPNYDPETNRMVELGIKSTVADGRLRVNAAVFQSEYEGIQLSSLTAVGTPPALLPNTLNAAPADIRGAELELTGLFGGVEFNLGVGWLDAEFTEDALLTDSQTNTNRLVPDGSQVPFAPEITANAGVQYQFNAGSWTITPRLQASYMDEQLSTPFEYVATVVPSRTITDLRVTMMPSDKVRFEAFATNLFDKTYIAAQVQDASSASGGLLYGAPRQFGVRLKFDF
jgi:iron complex outermembrane receptor protein